jgi:fructuronate reductase
VSSPRLSPATAARAPASVAQPHYDRARLRPGIVHLGLGAFFRAHGVLYTEDVLAEDPAPWGIIGVSLQRPDQRDRLAPQGCLYTATECEADAPQTRIVGSVLGVLVAPEDPQAVLAAMAAPETRIVSLTVTEKGYCLDPATGRLDPSHPDIAYDLAHPGAPRSAVGLITAALARRRDAGLAPFTAVCCDNLMANGPLLAGLVQDFAALTDDHLAQWIARNAAFPATMVDRIVPATTPADIAMVEAVIGLHDAAPVLHERFRQWVIEDRFVDGHRPPWEHAGAELVADVAPYEHMKLRMLNASHSALAYLGYLAGHETIAEAVADPAMAAYLPRLWAEIAPMIPPPPGVSLAAYAEALLARYANPAIRHRTWQIAMDGSQKLPVRLLPTIRERLARGLASPCLSLAVAAWLRYAGGADERGAPIDVRDPLAAPLRAALDAAGPEPAARVAAALTFPAIFGTDLPAEPRFAAAVTDAYTRLRHLGARAAALTPRAGDT